MSDLPNNVQIQLSIDSIRLGSFQVKDAGRMLSAPLDAKDGYEFTLGFNVESNNEAQKVVATLNALLKNKATKEELASIVTIMEFTVTNIDSFIKTGEDGKPLILHTAMQIFASIIFSTTRGMFVTYAATTKFHNAYLPVVDMSKFIPQARAQSNQP
jgi:methyl coenzyme M reductase alpha subunit